jgi:hypothetical protein
MIYTLRKASFILRLLVLVVLISPACLFSQNFNPPFPRTAFQSPTGTYGGAADHIFAQFDLVDHALRGPNAKAFNDSIRALNPDIIILGTSRQGAWVNSEPAGMLAFHAVFFTLKNNIQPGDTEIDLLPANDYALPSKHKYALIGEDDWITYDDFDGNRFVGVPGSGV